MINVAKSMPSDTLAETLEVPMIKSNVVALPVESKACTRCKSIKSLTDFYRVKTTGYYNSECKECHKADCRERNAKWSKEHPEKKREYGRQKRKRDYADPVKRAKRQEWKRNWNKSDVYLNGYYRKRFGVTLNEVNSMLAIQNGRCANIACGTEISIHPKDNQKKAIVDHCHTTGRVRSMMCQRCNTTLGHVEDTQSVIFGLLDYLNKYSTKGA